MEPTVGRNPGTLSRKVYWYNIALVTRTKNTLNSCVAFYIVSGWGNFFLWYELHCLGEEQLPLRLARHTHTHRLNQFKDHFET